MRKQIFTAMILIAATGITTQASAQMETATAKKANWDLKTNTTARMVPTTTGCDIIFDHEVISPRDASSGLPTGKRQHKPYVFSISSADNSVTESNSPKVPPSGQPAGKVAYSDLSVMMQMERAATERSVSPKKLPVEDGQVSLPTDFVNGACDVTLSWSWGASNSGSTGRCTKTFTLTMQDGTLMAINEKGSSSTKH